MRKYVFLLLISLAVFYPLTAQKWLRRVIKNRIERREKTKRLKEIPHLFDAIILNDKEKITELTQKGVPTSNYVLDDYPIEQLINDELLRIKLFQPLEYQKHIK